MAKQIKESAQLWSSFGCHAAPHCIVLMRLRPPQAGCPQILHQWQWDICPCIISRWGGKLRSGTTVTGPIELGADCGSGNAWPVKDACCDAGGTGSALAIRILSLWCCLYISLICSSCCRTMRRWASCNCCLCWLLPSCAFLGSDEVPELVDCVEIAACSAGSFHFPVGDQGNLLIDPLLFCEKRKHSSLSLKTVTSLHKEARLPKSHFS